MNLDVVRVGSAPPETDAPLVVDPDAVQASPVAPQSLEPVPWRYAQVGEGNRSIDLSELAQGRSLHLRPELPDRVAPKETLSVQIAEAPNHTVMITLRVMAAKQWLSGGERLVCWPRISIAGMLTIIEYASQV